MRISGNRWWNVNSRRKCAVSKGRWNDDDLKSRCRRRVPRIGFVRHVRFHRDASTFLLKLFLSKIDTNF